MALLPSAMATMVASMNQKRKDRMTAAMKHAKEEKQQNDLLMKFTQENAAYYKLTEKYQHTGARAREAEQLKKTALQALHKIGKH